MPQVSIVTRVMEFGNGCVVNVIAQVFADKRSAEEYIEQAQAEISTLLAAQLVVAHPDGKASIVGRGETMLGVMGLRGVQFRISVTEAKESRMIQLPPEPSLIVPGR